MAPAASARGRPAGRQPFRHVTTGRCQLPEMGRRALWQGAQEIEITRGLRRRCPTWSSPGAPSSCCPLRGGGRRHHRRSDPGGPSRLGGAERRRSMPAGCSSCLVASTFIPTPGSRPARSPTDSSPTRSAAAFGGTTTLLDFNNPGTGDLRGGLPSLLAGLREFRAAHEGRVRCRLRALCGALSGAEDPLAELPRLIRAGVPTFKAFMVYDFRLATRTLDGPADGRAATAGCWRSTARTPAIIDRLLRARSTRVETACRFHATSASRVRRGGGDAARDRPGPSGGRIALHRASFLCARR